MRSWDLQAVETIFAAAAVDASLWSKAIQTASEQTESIGALILPVTGQGIPYVPASEGLRAPLKSISATAGASVTFAIRRSNSCWKAMSSTISTSSRPRR